MRFLMIIIFSSIISTGLTAQNKKVFKTKFLYLEVPSDWTSPDQEEISDFPDTHIPMGAKVCEISLAASSLSSITSTVDYFSMPFLEIKDTFETDYHTFEYYEKKNKKYWIYEDLSYNLAVTSQNCPDHIPVLDMIKTIQIKSPKIKWKSNEYSEFDMVLDIPKHWDKFFIQTDDNSVNLQIHPYGDVTINIIKYLTKEETILAFKNIPGDADSYKTDHLNFSVKKYDRKGEKWYLTEFEDNAVLIRLHPYNNISFCRCLAADEFIKRLKAAK